MNIHVHSRNLLGEDQLSTLVQRVEAALDRYEHVLRRVVVELRDVNGPRGGVDAQCRIHIVLRRGGIATVSALDVTPLASVAAAADRARRRVTRLVEDARERGRRETPSPRITAWARAMAVSS